MLAAIMNRALPGMYRMLGEDAVHTSASGTVAPDTKRVILDIGGSTGLDVMQQTIDPMVKVQASQFPSGLQRGDTLRLRGTEWRVREAALPTNDGTELQAPLAALAVALA